MSAHTCILCAEAGYISFNVLFGIIDVPIVVGYKLPNLTYWYVSVMILNNVLC